MNNLASILVVILVGTLDLPRANSGTAPESAGQVLAKVSKLPPDQRQKTLVEKAKGEGEVSFYSSLQAQQIDPFIRVFQKRYPFVKVNPYRVSGNRQVIKIQPEMNAGNHLFDVTNGSAEQASALKKIGAIDPYPSPQRDYFNAPNTKRASLRRFTLYPLCSATTPIWSNGRMFRKAMRTCCRRSGRATCFWTMKATNGLPSS
jgi:hypothetical protein